MQAKSLITSLILCAFTFFCLVIPSAYSSDHMEVADYYESCIVKKIKKCSSMVVLLSSSKSENLIDYAKMEAHKASFLYNEKEILVKEMIEMGLEPKQYRIDLFLNSRFQESFPYKK